MRRPIILRITIGAALLLSGAAANTAQVVPPAGYGGSAALPGVAPSPEPGAPALTRLDDATLQPLFRIDPAYPRAAMASAKVVGAFAVAEPRGTHLVTAWAPGFLPVTLSFSDGRCFALGADYTGGRLANGRLARVACIDRPRPEPSPAPPPGRLLRLVGAAWGYGAWTDMRAETTVVTAPNATTFQPLFTARMATDAIAAMNGPDWPGGNITLVGRIGRRLTVVTLEVGY